MKSKLWKASWALALPLGLAMTACVDEPDGDDIFTFTGQTIEDYLSVNEDFSHFNYILQRSGYDRLMDSYGSYTCFAPTNEAVIEYIDSLYRDEENQLFPHNGMTENSLEGLSDSLCTDIAEYHLARTEYTFTSITNGSTISTFLGRNITATVDDRGTLLNDAATVVGRDNEMTNGLVHVIDRVIPRSNRLVGSELEKTPGYGMFYDLLEVTGLLDILNGPTEKTQTFTPPSTSIGASGGGTAGIGSYYIQDNYTCKIGYTLFAVPDEILINNYGIRPDHVVEDMAALANSIYARAAEGSVSTPTAGWYDYYRNNGAQISTGTDYTDSLNCLNMLMRYHIIYGAVASDMLTVDYMVATNYTHSIYDYYETLLPKTLIKIWTPDERNMDTYINRWELNNTLTDNVQTQGSAAMHEVRRIGSYVHRNQPMQPLNGYIYPIDSLLVYDYYVPQGVLNERMRFEFTTCLPELSSNGYRGLTQPGCQALSGSSSTIRLRFPSDYFDNVVTFNGSNTTLDMNCRAGATGHDFILYQGDSFQGMGEFDLAIKLPPVPDREYELRLDVTLGGGYFGMMQFYLGDSPSLTSFAPVDIPIDFRMSADDPRLGCTNPETEDDWGVATDAALRTRKWMRGPMNYARRADDGSLGGIPTRIAQYSVRRILVSQTFNQRDYWLRLKSVLSNEHKYQIDYIEFCPVDVAENQRYLEDVY